MINVQFIHQINNVQFIFHNKLKPMLNGDHVTFVITSPKCVSVLKTEYCKQT